MGRPKILISATEPATFRTLGKVSPIPERYGCDFLIVKGKARTGIQRKKFPEDLLASLADNRLNEQLHKMGSLDRVLFIMEGFGQWTTEGELMARTAFTKRQMYGLFFTLAWEFGAQVIQVRDANETKELLANLELWAEKDKHTSLKRRSGPRKDSWGNTGVKEYGMHFLQSFPGMGPGLAEKVWEHFGGVPVKWDLEGIEDLIAVPGIGTGRAKNMWEVLEYQ